MTTPILVMGSTNMETTLRYDDGFPIAYEPVRYPFFGVRSSVGGVGYKIARALTTLGAEVRLLSVVGRDDASGLVRSALEKYQISSEGVLPLLDETPQTAIVYEAETGRRMVFSDLKDVQDAAYPADVFRAAADGVSLAVMTNINYARPHLSWLKERGIRIATDVHTLATIDDAYNADYLRAADILFLSDERLPEAAESFARRVYAAYSNEIIVIGMGADGALLHTADGGVQVVPAQQPRPVVNTVGAGDSLFAAFVWAYGETRNALASLEQAVMFAGWKIGVADASGGFMTAEELQALMAQR